jgi:serine/threonine protein kinase
MLGGKLLGQGSYGCVFKPALECKGKKVDTIGTNKVTKLLTKEHAEKEEQLSAKIRTIPYWKNYFAVSESICVPSTSQKKEKDLDKCEVLEGESLTNFRLLTMTYAGKELYNFPFDVPHCDFMAFVKHFVAAGAMLNIYGIVHGDLHQGNIVVDAHNVPRIIDFNLSHQAKHAVIMPREHSHEYYQDPPDFTLVNAIAKRYAPANVIRSIVYKKNVFRLLHTILGIQYEDMLDRLNDFHTREYTLQTWFQTYWPKIDSWAIGANIVYLIKTLSYSPAFTQTLQRIKGELFPVLRDMCAISPIDRIHCVEALHRLNPNHFIFKGKEPLAKAWVALF